jgi:hypothetical protein
MNLKRFLIVITLVLSSNLLLTAERRNQPLPLKELQNPDSPSYVPIPYPQTREDIITDVKYVIKKLYEPRKNRFSIHVKNSERRGPVLLELLKENGRLKFGNIIKVKDNLEYSPDDYSFLVDILDENNLLEARMHFKASGLWSLTGFYDEELKKKIKPIAAKEKEKEIFYNRGLNFPVGVEIIDMELVIFGYFHITSPLNPIWVIKTNSNTYYMDTIEYDIYRLVQKFPIKELKSMDWKSSKGQAFKSLMEKYPTAIEDNVNDEAFVLEKITKAAVDNKK